MYMCTMYDEWLIIANDVTQQLREVHAANNLYQIPAQHLIIFTKIYRHSFAYIYIVYVVHRK